MSPLPYPLITKEESELIRRALSYQELSEIALQMLTRIRLVLPKDVPILQVCGPITSGGAFLTNSTDPLKDNFRTFQAYINLLVTQARPCWSQIPFEARIQKVKQEDPDADLMQEFYAPIFRSRLIRPIFMQNWHESKGTAIEYGFATLLGMPVCYFSRKETELVRQQLKKGA